MADEVKIIRSKWNDGHEYQAFCLRCQRHVCSDRTSVWASKRPAVTHAREHIARHAARDAELADWLAQGKFNPYQEIVDTVTPEEQTCR